MFLVLNRVFKLHVSYLDWTHFDAQRFTNQCKQRCGKMTSAVFGYRHIHSNQMFVRKSVRTFTAKPDGRSDIPQHFVHVRVVNSTTKILGCD